MSPIVEILKVNKAVFELFDQIGFMEELYQECPLRELVTVVLETHFQNKKPFILGFENLKKNIKISKMIQVDVTKDLIQDNFKELIHFLVYAKGFEGIREVARDLCKLATPSSRSLVGPDLVNLFKVIDRYQLTDELRPLLVNVAPNLMTIESLKIFDYSRAGLGEQADFALINERMERQDVTNKKMILKRYENIFHQEPQLLQQPEASLSPLSYLMADVFDQYSDEEVLVSHCVQMKYVDVPGDARKR